MNFKVDERVNIIMLNRVIFNLKLRLWISDKYFWVWFYCFVLDCDCFFFF